MNIKQIETFVWIARLGSFAAAGQRLNATQSAISARIQELEFDLGVQLFIRGRRAAKLTARGQELLGMAEILMGHVWEIQSKIGRADHLTGIIRIGVADLIAVTWLGELVKDIHSNYKRVTLDIQVGLAKDLVERLRSGELDIILSPGKIWTSEFQSSMLGCAEFVWMANKSSFVHYKKLTPIELCEMPIITLSKQSYHHKIINDWFRKDRIIHRNYIECNSIAVIKSLTQEGIGIGLLPTYYVRTEVESGDLRILDCHPQIEPIELYAFVPHDTAHPLAQLIAEIAQRICPLRQDAFIATSLTGTEEVL